MVEKKRARRFILPFLVVGLLAALILLLPLVPQPGLKARLTDEFSQVLLQPCQMQEVRLKLLPRPAIAVQGFACRGLDFNLKVLSLELDFSPFFLLPSTPLIGGIHLRGVLAEIPFVYLFPEVDGKEETPCLFPGLLKKVFNGKKQNSAQISLHDGVCKLTGIPGCKKPLLFSGIEGKWRSQPQNQSENFELVGDFNGGQGRLQVTLYNVEGAPSSDNAVTDDGDRLEISCRLQGVSLPESEALFWGPPESRWRVDFANGDLDFDINGNPEGGLRFTGKLAADNHQLYSFGENLDSGQLCSQGSLQANFSGFFQSCEGYLNIKNAFLEYPEAATLFSRGLIRFREPLFVDLVNHLKIDDLNRTIENCPLLQLSGYQCEGSLEGDFKLVGNPLLVPVLKVDLNSEKIVLRVADPVSESLIPVADADFEKIVLAPEDPEGIALEVEADETQPALDWRDYAANFLRRLAKWEWIVKSDCRIGLLELPDMKLNELSFRAEKNLVQFEIERLAARFGTKGQLRLSLILDDLLHGARWQASLVAKKLDLNLFSKTPTLTGILDASLVGEGRLGFDSERGEDLSLNGKWKLRQGSFVEQPLFTAFNHFLEQEGELPEGAGFSVFSGKFNLRNKVLRLDDFELSLRENRLKAKGRYFAVGERLDFHGRYSGKDSFPVPFFLSGNRKNPIFTADH